MHFFSDFKIKSIKIRALQNAAVWCIRD